MPCIFCKKKIDAAASRCPYCQGQYTPDQVAARSKSANKSLVIGCMSVVGLAMLVGMCSSQDNLANVPETPTADAKADMLKLYSSVLATVEPCDRAATGVFIMAKSGDPIGTYQAAENASGACLGVSSDIGKLEVPRSVGSKHFKALETTLKNCEDAYIAKWSTMQNMGKALDGDGKVSDLAAVKGSAEASHTGALACIAGLVGVASDLGVKPEELPVTQAVDAK